MQELIINELRKKKSQFSIRVSDEERTALEAYCQKEQISYSDFFRLAIRKVINQKSSK